MATEYAKERKTSLETQAFPVTGWSPGQSGGHFVFHSAHGCIRAYQQKP
jgi:hypothetical protein